MALHSPSADPLNGISLCAGAGGLELGIGLAEPGYRTVCYVERDAFAAAVLVARMADQAICDAPVWDDAFTFDGRPWRGRVDILSAGYPCQPFSTAGKRRGGDDPRHLWPAIERIIGECEPRRVFFENVEGHVSLGLADVARALGRLGYRVAAGLFSARECGANHARRRLFIMADADRAEALLKDADPDLGIERRSSGESVMLVAQMTPAQIKASTRQLFVDQPVQIVAIGKAKKIRESLSQFGEVIVYDTQLQRVSQ